MLEIGDGAANVGKDGLKVGENLRGRLACVSRRQRQRRLGWRPAPTQGGADLALGQIEPVPEALPGPLIQFAVEGAAGRQDAAGEGGLEKLPQGARGQAEPPDSVGEPDAEGPSATGTCVTVAAEDAPGAQLFVVVLVASVQGAMPDQCADHLAVWTAHLLEPLRKRRPFFLAVAKPSLLIHGNRASAEMTILPAPGEGGARYWRGTIGILARGAG